MAESQQRMQHLSLLPWITLHRSRSRLAAFIVVLGLFHGQTVKCTRHVFAFLSISMSTKTCKGGWLRELRGCRSSLLWLSFVG